MSQCAAIIAAAGSGERFGATLPKALISLGNRTLIEHAVAALAPIASEIVICAPAGYEKQIQELVGSDITVVVGGTTRSDSVRAGIAALSGKSKYVLVHDAARALATTELAQRVLTSLEKGEVAVIPGLELIDTVKSVDAKGHVTSTPDRTTMRRVQTPQGFDLDTLKKAHASGADATDDGALVEALGHKVLIINGEERALKITTPTDLATAISLLGTSQDLEQVWVLMHMHSQMLVHCGWQDCYGLMKQALKVTLMAMLQPMQSVMLYLQPHNLEISEQTLEQINQSMQVHQV
jgi:2-C-methyl-D-erythritol 4-phosphate cytidylyltransferase / 2-C-methyl-D-erythritol 2,4-cyclodiphosphate synthase